MASAAGRGAGWVVSEGGQLGGRTEVGGVEQQQLEEGVWGSLELSGVEGQGAGHWLSWGAELSGVE